MAKQYALPVRPMEFHFTKVFTQKTCLFEPGDRFEDKITFPSLSGFVRWARDINALNALGKVEYRVEVY